MHTKRRQQENNVILSVDSPEKKNERKIFFLDCNSALLLQNTEMVT